MAYLFKNSKWGAINLNVVHISNFDTTCYVHSTIIGKSIENLLVMFQYSLEILEPQY